jgi:SPRY domain
MSCVKHNADIINYCQVCTVFMCPRCPSHQYHSTIDYSLYISQCISEIEALTKSTQARQKLLEMLQIKIKGYLASINQNKTSGLQALQSSVELVHQSIDQRHQQLQKEILDLTERFIRPLNTFEERIKGYLLQTNQQITANEKLITKISSKNPQDPILITNDMRKLNISESYYIDQFISTCKSTLENKIPVIPIVQTNQKALESSLYLDYTSNELIEKPLFPYWNIDCLPPSLKLKDQGSTISSKTETWATALFKDIFSNGKSTIEFLILKDGSGNKLYIGVIDSNSTGVNLTKPLSSTSGHQIWCYRICGELHSQNYINSNHKDKRRYRRGDKIKIELDMERMSLTFYKNLEEIYTFINISDRVAPFVCFGEAFQVVKVLGCESNNPKVIYH